MPAISSHSVYELFTTKGDKQEHTGLHRGYKWQQEGVTVYFEAPTEGEMHAW